MGTRGAVILRIHIPGNPWAGAINRRDRAGVKRDGTLFNRKQAGFKAYQDAVALWARSAANAQGWRTITGAAHVWIVLRVSDRRRRDVDGPIKAILDGLTAGRVWADDSQAVRIIVDKVEGEPSARVLVREVPGVVPGSGAGGLTRRRPNTPGSRRGSGPGARC
jgi:Holliday junction resolvase RusA-like endonuclease